VTKLCIVGDILNAALLVETSSINVSARVQEMSESGKVKTGGCLCGKVKYKLEGEAATPVWQTVCYCLNCRRRSGSALYTAAICPKNVSNAISKEVKVTL
jgi:hypothetical protein